MPHAALFLAVLLASLAKEAKPAAHPDVGADPGPDACASCHAEATPEVVKQWEAGPHGLLLVKCFVCHGSSGADFAATPRAQRCQGCHAEKLAAVAPARKVGPKACFACHAPHSLEVQGKKNPHVASR